MPSQAPDPRPRWSDLVHRHVHETVGYVVRSGDDAGCRDIQEKETGGRVPGRRFRALDPEALHALDMPASWMVGVLVGPQETLRGLVDWALRLETADLGRIRVYHLPDVALGTALGPWATAGLPPPKAFLIRSWQSFHKLFGLHHAVQVYADFAPAHPDV